MSCATSWPFIQQNWALRLAQLRPGLQNLASTPPAAEPPAPAIGPISAITISMMLLRKSAFSTNSLVVSCIVSSWLMAHRRLVTLWCHFIFSLLSHPQILVSRPQFWDWASASLSKTFPSSRLRQPVSIHILKFRWKRGERTFALILPLLICWIRLGSARILILLILELLGSLHALWKRWQPHATLHALEVGVLVPFSSLFALKSL